MMLLMMMKMEMDEREQEWNVDEGEGEIWTVSRTKICEKCDGTEQRRLHSIR